MSSSHRANDAAIPTGPLPFVWAAIVSPHSARSPQLRRADWLTPYIAGTIAEDALRAGRGARLEITVARGASPAAFAAAENWFSALPARGIEVSIRLADDLSATGTTDTDQAA